MAVSSLANAYWVTGKTGEADKLLNELQGRAEHRFIPPFFFFSMHKTRGDLDKASDWFERAVHERDFMLVFCTTWPGEEWRIPEDRRFHDALGRLR
jgi:hypothetical protein